MMVHFSSRTLKKAANSLLASANVLRGTMGLLTIYSFAYEKEGLQSPLIQVAILGATLSNAMDCVVAPYLRHVVSLRSMGDEEGTHNEIHLHATHLNP